MFDRLIDSLHSFRAMPTWVQCWVGGVLVPAIVAPFFFLDSELGRVAALASIFVAVTNLPIMLIERGMSRLMAIPHLIAWIPLIVYLGWILANAAPLGVAERSLAIALILITGVSVVFDVFDTYRWVRGEREIPGH